MKISVQSLFEDYEDDTVELRRDTDTARILEKTMAKLPNARKKRPLRLVLIAAAAVALVAGAAWFCLSNPASTFDEDIIGGADGPTSIFLAGKLSGGDDTASFVSGENLKLGGDEEKIYEVVKTFAEAAGNRDAVKL